MDTEKMRAALAYLKKKKPELTVQQYRTIKGQILAGDEDGAIRGIDRVVERNRRGRGYQATKAEHPVQASGVWQAGSLRHHVL